MAAGSRRIFAGAAKRLSHVCSEAEFVYQVKSRKTSYLHLIRAVSRPLALFARTRRTCDKGRVARTILPLWARGMAH